MKASDLYKATQGNRGVPKFEFVDELFEIFKKMGDGAFAVNDKADIYTAIAPQLGPWTSLQHRRAAGFEAMVALAGRESSWNWNEGRDLSAGNTSSETEESGAWQTSFNARVFHPSAKALVSKMTGDEYIKRAKTDHEFAALFTWYVLRGTTKHHGPIVRHEINPYLSRTRVESLVGLFNLVHAPTVPLEDALPVEDDANTDTEATESKIPWRDWFLARKGWTEFDHDKELSKGWKLTGLDYKTVIGSEHAWCGMSLATALNSCGYKIAKGAAAAASWDKYGTPVDYKRVGIPQGAVVTIRHSTGGRHVTTADRDHKVGELVLSGLGGNQGNSINVTQFNLAKGHDAIVAVRWPQKA